MQGLIATKVGMSRVFLESGEAVPVTYLKVEPNTVVRTKTADKDGYNAVVLGVGAKQWKTRKGKEHTKYRLQKEWPVESVDGIQPGAQVTSAIIPEESLVTVTGVSKGKGFQGVIKRHGFSRGPETHGSHHHRRPGSIGMKEFPGRVLKGKKLPGQQGGDQVTVKHRAVLLSDAENNMIAIKGPVPGPNGANVFVTFEFEAEWAADAPATEESASAPADQQPEEKVEKEDKQEKDQANDQEQDQAKDEEPGKDAAAEAEPTEATESSDESSDDAKAS